MANKITLMQAANGLDSCLFEVESSLAKLQLLGEGLAEFFDNRDAVQTSEEALHVIQVGFHEAAVRHDMTGDYLRSLRHTAEQIRYLVDCVGALAEEEEKENLIE